MRRTRGRGGNNGHSGNNGNNGGGNNNQHRRSQTPSRHQVYDSNGPEVRIRGNAAQIYEKYQNLARDAHASGDRVKAESFLQHAEHYYRIMLAIQEATGEIYQAQRQPGDELTAEAPQNISSEMQPQDQAQTQPQTQQAQPQVQDPALMPQPGLAPVVDLGAAPQPPVPPTVAA